MHFFGEAETETKTHSLTKPLVFNLGSVKVI